jgi:tetratricopeptide (TPR) repeat protein
VRLSAIRQERLALSLSFSDARFWEDAPFSSLQILPTDAKPVTQWSDRDEAFWDITMGIRKAVLDLRLLKTKQEWIDKGNAHHYLKHYKEALAAYEQAIHLDPNDAGVYVDKATNLINLERYEEARMASNQAIRLDSNNAFAYSK